MRSSLRRQSILIAALVALGSFGIASQPQPAVASTLTATLGCETLRTGFICDGYVSGGTGIYTYSWNILYKSRYDGAASSTITVSCSIGTTRSVTFSVQDSSGATASKSVNVYCSGGTP
ncbi:MAG TPA: hypothetical protein VGD69_12890 [Herpetosiphonaceae bacterium]